MIQGLSASLGSHWSLESNVYISKHAVYWESGRSLAYIMCSTFNYYSPPCGYLGILVVIWPSLSYVNVHEK